MKAHKFSVASAVIIALCILITSLLGLVGVLNYMSVKQQRWQELTRNLDLAAEQLATGLAISLWNVDDSQIGKVMESTMQMPEVFGIVVRSEGSLYVRQRTADGFVQSQAQVFAPPEGLAKTVKVTFRGQDIGSASVYLTRKYYDEALKKPCGIPCH